MLRPAHALSLLARPFDPDLLEEVVRELPVVGHPTVNPLLTGFFPSHRYQILFNEQAMSLLHLLHK